MAPDAVQGVKDDRDVRDVRSFLRTLKLMERRVAVITHAALWWAEEQIYGACDIMCLASWFYKKIPHLAPAAEEPDHYLILDCKFTSGLDQAKKREDLDINSSQIRLYGFMVGKIQGHMPRISYLVTRDRIADPLPVEVDHLLGDSLDPVLAEMRDRHLHIKRHGHKYLPWRDSVIGCNFANSNDAPWNSAKKQIAREHTAGGTLTCLPHMGKAQVEALATRGFDNLDSLLAVHPASVDFEGIGGIGDITAGQIRAMLEAHRSRRASPVPASSLPARADAEFFCDLEYFSNVHVDFDNDWPDLQGREMVFMVGIGWEEGGQWCYRQFVATKETRDAERLMLEEFAGFLAEKGAMDRNRKVSLYHWSNAEVWQSARAAERLRLPHLECLPWSDLREIFHEIPIAVPGAWDYGLKTIATAVGAISPQHATV